MTNRANEYPDKVLCPLVDEIIDAGDCVVTQDITTGLLKPTALLPEFDAKENWREICKQCKYFENS